MAITRAYADNSTIDLASKPRARVGGPNPQGPAAAAEEFFGRIVSNAPFGSHMPLDVDMHWDWRNPLNIIPAMMVLLIVIALVAAIV